MPVKFEDYCEEVSLRAKAAAEAARLEELRRNLHAYNFGRRVQRFESQRDAEARNSFSESRVIIWWLGLFSGFCLALIFAGCVGRWLGFLAGFALGFFFFGVLCGTFVFISNHGESMDT